MLKCCWWRSVLSSLSNVSSFANRQPYIDHSFIFESEPQIEMSIISVKWSIWLPNNTYPMKANVAHCSSRNFRCVRRLVPTNPMERVSISSIYYLAYLLLLKHRSSCVLTCSYIKNERNWGNQGEDKSTRRKIPLPFICNFLNEDLFSFKPIVRWELLASPRQLQCHNQYKPRWDSRSTS